MRKNKHYETFIVKVLKDISQSSMKIKSSAKQHLNNILVFFSEILSKKSFELLELSERKTLTPFEIENSIRILLNGQLKTNSIQEAKRAIETYENSTCKGSKQKKAEIIFPPCI